jgi:hypothetical protein
MSDQLEQQLEQPAEGPEDREAELAKRVNRWVERPLVAIAVLICTYYGASQYGDSRYISHPLWQDIILWPIVVLAFVVILVEAAGPPGKFWRGAHHRRISRAIARRIVARQDRNGIQP